MTSTPPGWYPDGSGSLRYYDGENWTAHTHPIVPPEPAPEPVVEPGPALAPAVELAPAPAAQPALGPVVGYSVTGEPAWSAGPPVEVPPQKPLYKRTWFIVTAVVVAVLIIGAIFASGSSSDGDTPISSPTAAAPVVPLVSPTSAAAVPTSAPSTGAATTSSSPSPSSTNKVDGDWELVAFTPKKESFTGDFGGTGRIKYNGTDPDATNNFTVTLFKGGKQVASLLGPLPTIAPGQTKTVQFISTDKYVAGPYTIEFQKDL